MRSIVSNHRAIERRMNRRMEEKKEKQFRLPLFADTHIHCISDTIYSACGTRTKTEIEGIEPNAETRHTAKTVIMMSNKNILLYYIRWLISLQRGGRRWFVVAVVVFRIWLTCHRPLHSRSILEFEQRVPFHHCRPHIHKTHARNANGIPKRHRHQKWHPIKRENVQAASTH